MHKALYKLTPKMLITHVKLIADSMVIIDGGSMITRKRGRNLLFSFWICTMFSSQMKKKEERCFVVEIRTQKERTICRCKNCAIYERDNNGCFKARYKRCS